MSNRILLISAQYIKDRSPLFANVNDTLIRESILEAQEIEIKGILGSALYDEIINEVNIDNLKVENRILIDDYIAPALKFYTLLEASNFIRNSYTPTGIKQRTQESAQEIDYTEFKAYVSKWEKRAQYYAQRINLYIRAEYNENGYFKSFHESYNRIDQVRPRRNSYTSAIYLENTMSNCPWEYIEYEMKHNERTK